MLKPVNAAIAAEHDQDEQQAGQVEAAHQQRQRPERVDAVAADRERHRAAGADRRELHERVHHREEDVRGRLDELVHDLAARAHVRHRVAEEHRDEQHLQEIARAGKRVEERRRNDAEDELGRGLRRRALRVVGDRIRVERRGIGVEARARLDDVDHDERR